MDFSVSDIPVWIFERSEFNYDHRVEVYVSIGFWSQAEVSFLIASPNRGY